MQLLFLCVSVFVYIICSAIPKRAMQRTLNFKIKVFFYSLSSHVPRWSGNETTLSGLGMIYYDVNNICSKKSLQK